MSANVTELPRAGRHTKAQIWPKSLWRRARAEKRSALPPAAFPHRFFGFFMPCLYPHNARLELRKPDAGARTGGDGRRHDGAIGFFLLGLAYFRRGYDVREHSEALRRQLEMLTYPAEEAEARISQVSEALRKQAEELSRASDKATVDIGQPNALREQTEALSEVSDKAAGKRLR